MMRRANERGQALIELAVSFILFVTIVLGLVTFGHGFMAVNFITNAARDGARVAATWPDRGTCGLLQNTDSIGAKVSDDIAGVLGASFKLTGITVWQEPTPSSQGAACATAQTPTVNLKVRGCMHYIFPLLPDFSGSCSDAGSAGFNVERTVVFHDEGLGG